MRISSFKKTLNYRNLTAYVLLFYDLSENTLIRTRVLAFEYSDPYRVRECGLGQAVFMLVFNKSIEIVLWGFLKAYPKHMLSICLAVLDLSKDPLPFWGLLVAY